jgi:hypothetical protein
MMRQITDSWTQLHDDIDRAVGRIRMRQQAAFWAFRFLSESKYSLVKK